MVNYGAAVLRRSAAVVEGARAHALSTRRAISRFARPQHFAAPHDAETAAVRAVRNVSSFRLHYAAVLWALLLISLFPSHRATMLFLMAFSKAVLLYGALLRACPGSSILHRILDRRLVAVLAIAVVLTELVVTGAVPQLLLALGAGVPLVLFHAVFRVRDDLEDTDAAADSVARGEDLEKGTQ